MQLTKQQKEALDLFKIWVKKDSNKPFVVVGPAGSGKTTLVKSMLKHIKNYIIMAPTHQAGQVLAEKINEPVTTTAKGIGLSPNLNIEDFDPNNPLFVLATAGKLSKHKYGVQDESSMLCDNVVNIQTNKVKMIYLGDTAQLPPINTEMCQILNEPDYTLTEVIRTNNDDILTLSSILRKKDWKSKLKQTKFNSNSVVITTADEYVNQGEKILCYTNECVDKWNFKLRKDLKINTQDQYKFYDNINPFHNSQDFKFTSVIEEPLWYLCEIGKDWKGKVWKPNGFKEYGRKYLELKSNPKRFYDRYSRKQSKDYYKAWNEFYDWRAVNLIDRPFTYRNTYIKKQFSLGYAMTIHRSQGSTIPEVAIDLKDLRGKDIRSLLYVAVTRAQNKITLIK